MAPRRSLRLQGKVAPFFIPLPVAPRAAQRTPPSVLRNSRKRWRSSSPADDYNGAHPGKRVRLASGRPAPARPREPPVVSDDALSALPQEVFDLILDAIESSENGKATMSKLCRTSRRYQRIVGPRFHRTLHTEAPYHAHIPNLIRALEPYLSITQRKQLKKEGRYKGQQLRFSSLLDPDVVPACVKHIRSVTIGSVSPGRNHENICQRYLEEFFKNLRNVEYIEARVITTSMAKSLASMERLEALALRRLSKDHKASAGLVGVKNLKHLLLEVSGSNRFIGSMLFHSAATLQSLDIKGGPCYNFLEDWGALAPIGSPPPALVALRSLSLNGMAFDESFVESLGKAIDFTQLTRLQLDTGMGKNQNLFWQLLIDTFSLAKQRKVPIQLRHLDMMVPRTGWLTSAADVAAWFDMQCYFLFQFTTLESLVFKSLAFDHSGQTPMASPERVDRLTKGILRHRHLKNLVLDWVPPHLDNGEQWLPVSTLQTIIDTLPDLEILQLPYLTLTKEMAPVLSRGRSLRVIGSRRLYELPEGDTFVKGLQALLSAILSLDAGGCGQDEDGVGFVWERHSPLRLVSSGAAVWDISSPSPDDGKVAREERMTVVKDGRERQVEYRLRHGWVPPKARPFYMKRLNIDRRLEMGSASRRHIGR